jgi:hypothetical protein
MPLELFEFLMEGSASSLKPLYCFLVDSAMSVKLGVVPPQRWCHPTRSSFWSCGDASSPRLPSSHLSSVFLISWFRWWWLRLFTVRFDPLWHRIAPPWRLCSCCWSKTLKMVQNCRSDLLFCESTIWGGQHFLWQNNLRNEGFLSQDHIGGVSVKWEYTNITHKAYNTIDMKFK